MRSKNNHQITASDLSSMIKQRTLCGAIRARGIGLHTGKQVELALRPAPVDTGIIFRRIDLHPVVEIPALFNHVSNTFLGTTLRVGEATIATSEHLMSAFAGLGIDNVYVDINGSEVPIMDGSSISYVFLIESAGICEQDVPKKFLRILKRIETHNQDKWAAIEPFDGTRLVVEIMYNHPHVGFGSDNRKFDFTFSRTAFIKEISRARTFGFLSDSEMLQKNNLALGCCLDNAIVLDHQNMMNQECLRFSNEFVRHKMLDALGDLYLLGHHVVGAFFGYKSGHYLNNKLSLTLMNNSSAWELVTLSQNEFPVVF